MTNIQRRRAKIGSALQWPYITDFVLYPYVLSGLSKGDEYPHDTTLLQTLISPDNDTKKFTIPSTTHQMQLTPASRHDTERKLLRDKPHKLSLLQMIPYTIIHKTGKFSDCHQTSPTHRRALLIFSPTESGHARRPVTHTLSRTQRQENT